MPKRKKEDDSSDEDDVISSEDERPTKKTAAAKKRTTKEKLTDKQERDKLVGDTMRYMMFTDLKRHVVKREEINKNVLKDRKGAASQVITHAQMRFKDLFGFEMVELPNKKKTGSGLFVLQNALEIPPDLEDVFEHRSTEDSEHAVLMLVLGMIYISKGEIESDVLYAQLRRVGLVEKESHPIFGDWEKLLELKLTRELYLEKKKIKDRSDQNGKPIIVFRMGPRSLEEIGRKNVLTFVSDIYGEQVDPIELRDLEMSQAVEESSGSEEETNTQRGRRSSSSQMQSQQESSSPPSEKAQSQRGTPNKATRGRKKSSME